MRLVRPLLLVVSLASSLASSLAVASEVYRYVDKNGVVHYTDQPPNKTAKPVALPPLQVIGPTEQIDLPPPSPSDVSAAPRLGVSIASPSPEETFRGDDRQLPVTVRLDQQLPTGYGLLYLLDGRPQNVKATRQPRFVLQNVERGEHLVSVAVVNAAGREVARTAPVIVHMKPPTVQLSAPKGR